MEHPGVAVVSFTGSTAVGRMIARVAGERLAKVCLELGGKNPLVVCDDADLEGAAKAAALSAFSNAGQRCASGSRLIVFDSVYERVPGADRRRGAGPARRARRRARLRAGDQRAPARSDAGRGGARARGAGRACSRAASASSGPEHEGGFYMAPTLRRGRRAERRDRLHRAVRPDRDAAPRGRLRGGARPRRTTRPTGSPRRSGPRACTAGRSSSRASRAGWRR